MPKINNLDEAAAAVLDAQHQKYRLELRGLGTKTGIGNQPVYDACLDVSAMQGIVDYQPEELVLTVRAGTTLSAVEAALDEANQMLAFEPADLSALLKSKSTGTIGGVLATNLSGPRRLTAGQTACEAPVFPAFHGQYPTDARNQRLTGMSSYRTNSQDTGQYDSWCRPIPLLGFQAAHVTSRYARAGYHARHQ